MDVGVFNREQRWGVENFRRNEEMGAGSIFSVLTQREPKHFPKFSLKTKLHVSSFLSFSVVFLIFWKVFLKCPQHLKVPGPGIKPTPHQRHASSLTPRPPGNSFLCFFLEGYLPNSVITYQCRRSAI